MKVTEAIGGFINKGTPNSPKLVILSGFANSYRQVTPEVYLFNTTTKGSLNQPWIAQDNVPTLPGITHSAYVIVGDTIYVVGGYVGGTPGPHTNVTFQFRPNEPTGQQVTLLPELPDGGRGAGALFYLKSKNSLFYSSGAIRPEYDVTIDKTDSWELSLNSSEIALGWQSRTPIPYHSNHVSYVSVPVTINGLETQRHFVFGGQLEEDEPMGNSQTLYEWLDATQEWIQRRDMYFPRGHTSSSTVSHDNCGFITAGGSINGLPNKYSRTKDIAYYSLANDTWTSIGRLPIAVATPVCDIAHYMNKTVHYMYCQGGKVNQFVNFRRRILL